MLVFKNTKPYLLLITFFLIVIHSVNSVFLSIIISQVVISANTKSIELFTKYAVIGVLGFSFFTLVGIILGYFRTKLVANINLNIKRTVIKKVLGSDDYFHKQDQLSYLTNDLKQLETKGVEVELSIIYRVFTYSFSLIAAFRYDYVVALVFLFGSVVTAIITYVFQKQIRRSAFAWSNDNVSYTNKLKGYLLGYETIKSYQVEEDIIKDFTIHAGVMEKSLKKMNYKVEIGDQFIYLATMILAFLLPFTVGMFRVIDGLLLVPVFISLVYLSNSIRTPAIQIVNNFNVYRTTKPIRDKYLTNRIVSSAVIQNYNKFSSIKIDNLTYGYDKNPLFDGQSFEINKGDKIIIYGANGIGKTTLLKIIQTRIKISDNYLYNNELLTNDIKVNFAFISQRPVMFEGTIIYNITLGKDFDKDAINEAISNANLEDFINQVGLEYMIEEDGKNLSAGQIKKIEIARALISKRPIILADEMTSSLDEKSSRIIRQRILESNFTFIESVHEVEQDLVDKYNKKWFL